MTWVLPEASTSTTSTAHPVGLVLAARAWRSRTKPGGRRWTCFATAPILSAPAPRLDWLPGSTSYFSIDGGNTPYSGGYFATGRYHGDGEQASYWRDRDCSQVPLGILDPTSCPGTIRRISALDLAALDAIGWNTPFDVVRNPQLAFTTNSIFTMRGELPAPPPWTLVIGGPALLGLVC